MLTLNDDYSPSPQAQIETKVIENLPLTVYCILISYLITSFICFIYLLFRGTQQMSFIQKIFSSLFTPFALIIIFLKNTVHFVKQLINDIICGLFEYIINPIFRIILYYILVPIANLIDYIYRHSTIFKPIFMFIFDKISQILEFIWRKIIYPPIYFTFFYIIFPTIRFFRDYIISPFYNKVIIPVARFICSIHALQVIALFISKCYKKVHDFAYQIIIAIGKICKSIIDAAEELIKETYIQVILPFTQLTKRIFGD